MTAVTADEYDNRATREVDVRFAVVTAGRQTQWTPTNSSGKTIRILGAYHSTLGQAICSVTSGVVLIDTGDLGGAAGTYHIIYTLT